MIQLRMSWFGLKYSGKILPGFLIIPKTLCQDLDIRYDSLGGENTIEAKARELVDYCRRHGRMPDLHRACAEQRPHAFPPLQPGEYTAPADVTPE